MDYDMSTGYETYIRVEALEQEVARLKEEIAQMRQEIAAVRVAAYPQGYGR